MTRRTKKSKKKPAVNSDSQTVSLARSSLQEKVEALKQDQEWLFKQIKRKRTELSNFVAQIEEISREMYQRCFPLIEKMMERDREIHRMFKAILRNKKLSKKNQKKIKKVYQELQNDGVISPQTKTDRKQPFSSPETNEQEQEKASTEERKEISDPPSNQRNIRETFLRLASRFHPDKVTDSDTQNQYTAIMQEVNKAYQEGDFAKLLEIERKQHDAETISFSQEAETETDKQHSRLIRENEILRQQYEEIKQELRYLRNTPEGSMVSDYRRAKKEGIDPLQEVVEEGESQLEFITEVRDFVQDFQNRKITLEEFLEGPNIGMELTPEDLEFILDEIIFDLENSRD
ncbi:J domain-containing protein [Dactylococcopsis salina]|uniref:DnaJ-like protein n=1 Tax=Dactylococcopsis salina (strain PCC 8305) TaxID=13035 RepID=K9YSU5_DACS8|nr:J domain-containing protein [Dactylococcopsis salina]AFZ49959.1 DnaJ-like protein [Dactylococcopsis salina PCC 8305]